MLSACNLSLTAEPHVTLEPVSIKLSWHHSAQFLGFYIAQNRGFYAEEGLTVTIEPLTDTTESDATPHRVAVGDYDFGVGGPSTTFTNLAEPLTMIASIYQFQPGAFFARAELGILTPSDLAGHSVVVKSEAWQGQLVALLEHSGLTLEDVEQVQGGFDNDPLLQG